MPRWLITTALATFFFGLNAAFIEVPEKFVHPPFPTTLGYVVWSGTMLLCAAVAVGRRGWRVETSKAAIGYGAGVGLLGSVGQILCFVALRDGPAYIVIPIASLYPVVTVILAVLYLRERIGKVAGAGIAFAFAAILLLSLGQPPDSPVHGWHWLLFCVMTMVMWGLQAWLIKLSSGAVSEESLFFYMALSAVLVVPAALWLTDFSKPVNWGWMGPGLAAAIQLPNAVAALLQIYAYREGKVAIVAPMIALYPLVTIVLSLLVYRRIPDVVTAVGMGIALAAIYLIARAEVSTGTVAAADA